MKYPIRKHGISKVMTAALFASTLLGTTYATSAGSVGPGTHDDVYIDPPTGFAFVKTPAGWKFIRKVDEKSYRDYTDSVEAEKLAARGKSASGKL